MTETKWQASRRREREREELTDTLNRGRREIDKNMNEMEGWADRIMRSLLTPLGNEASSYWNPLRIKNGGAQYKREQ